MINWSNAMFVVSGKYKRKQQRKRNALLKSISFKCDLCGCKIQAKRNSLVFKLRLQDEITQEEAINILKESHFRHIHTDYDLITSRIYDKLRENGYEITDAKILAKERARKQIEPIMRKKP